MPKIVDHDQRRYETALAFFRVILAKGIEGATTREIAREAGVSLSLLSHYFGDKDGLVLAAFDVLVARFTARLTAAAKGKASAAAVLEALCLSALPLDDERRLESGAWMAFWAHGYASDAARRRQMQEYEVWIDTLARVIAALPQARTRDQARDAATALAALVDGLTIQLMLRGPDGFSAADAEAQVRRHLAALG